MILVQCRHLPLVWYTWASRQMNLSLRSKGSCEVSLRSTFASGMVDWDLSTDELGLAVKPERQNDGKINVCLWYGRLESPDG